MKVNVISAYGFVLFVVLCVFYLMFSNVEYMDEDAATAEFECPPPGPDGEIECENIEDKALRELKCKSIQMHCQLEKDKKGLPESSIPIPS